MFNSIILKYCNIITSFLFYKYYSIKTKQKLNIVIYSIIYSNCLNILEIFFELKLFYFLTLFDMFILLLYKKSLNKKIDIKKINKIY